MNPTEYIQRNKKKLLKVLHIFFIILGSVLLFHYHMIIAGSLLLVIGYFLVLKND